MDRLRRDAIADPGVPTTRQAMPDLDKPEQRNRWEKRTRIAARIVEKLNRRFRWLLNLWLEGLSPWGEES